MSHLRRFFISGVDSFSSPFALSEVKFSILATGCSRVSQSCSPSPVELIDLLEHSIWAHNLSEDRGGVEIRLTYELDIILLHVCGSVNHSGDDCGGEDFYLIESGEAA